jgi:hypothetical protein
MITGMTVDASHAVERITRMTPDIREALTRSLGQIAANVAADARARAQSHIHVLGLKPGAYVDSIKGGVAVKENRVTGYVRSGSPLAHLLEFGANVPPHEILPSIAQALAFDGGAGTVFAAVVHSPGAAIPPYPAIYPAFEAAKPHIEAALIQAASINGN